MMNIIFEDGVFWTWFYNYRLSEMEANSRRNETSYGSSLADTCFSAVSTAELLSGWGNPRPVR